MEASELRIGNLVKDGNDFEQVTIYHLDCLSIGRCEFDPIPLTDEWLLKFGFHEKYKSSANRWCFDSWCIWDCEDEDGNLSHEFMYEFRTQIKYVHQLQNLYFALTNEELTYEQQK